MKCPYCFHKETKVLDSRDVSDERSIRRRRECLKCHKRFTTYERLETSNIIVNKKDGKRETYNREKLKKGILKACEKRPVKAEDIDKAIDKIEVILVSSGNEIKSQKIGELIMKHLKKLDKVAYIRFASVYRDFADINTFEEEVKKLLKNR